MPAGPDQYKLLDLKGMEPYVDYLDIMAFDYTGSFSPLTGHHSNLYASKTNPQSTPFNTDAAVSYYLAAGIPSRKLGFGFATYGRSFLATTGPALGAKYNGVGPGQWEPGTWDFKSLPQKGAKEYIDKDIVASWSWDATSKTIISYDNKLSAAFKAKYLIKRALGGAMFWELSGDKAGADGLVGTVVEWLRGAGPMDSSLNTLSYPKSVYNNVKAGMPGQ